MDFIKLTCPCCSATLKVEPDELFVTCDYCDQTFERKIDAEEKNKIARKNNLKKLKDYITAMDALEKLKAEVKKAQQAYDASQAEKNSLKSSVSIASIFIGLIFCSLFFKLVIGNLLSHHPFVALFLFLLCGGIAFAGVFFGKGYYVAKRLKKEEICTEKEKVLNAVIKKEEEFRKEFDISFLPEKYRRKDTAMFFMKMFEEERASTMQDAFNLYEDELVKKQNKAYQQEQLRLKQEEIEELRRMNNNAEATRNNAQQQYKNMQQQYENMQRQYEDMQRQSSQTQYVEVEKKSHLGRTAAIIGGIALIGHPVTKKIIKGIGKGLFH